MPSCPSLDCVTFLTLTVEDFGCPSARSRRERIVRGNRLPPRITWLHRSLGKEIRLESFATLSDADLGELCGDVERGEKLFRGSIERLEQSGARRLTVDFAPFRKVAALLYDGPWIVERLAGLRGFSAKPRGRYASPVTRSIIKGAKNTGPSMCSARCTSSRLCGKSVCGPSSTRPKSSSCRPAPRCRRGPTSKPDSVRWSQRLGTYTNFVNLLGLSALAVPAGLLFGAGLPAGIHAHRPRPAASGVCAKSAWPGSDSLICRSGRTGNQVCAGGTSRKLGAKRTLSPMATSAWRLPTHTCKVSRCTRPFAAAEPVVRACRTAAKYRFFAFMNLDPPRPGLLHNEERAGAIAVEIYDLPMEGFGRLVASVAPPLAIGTVDLEDGEAVKGFLCESWETLWARDITDFEGWIDFRNHLGEDPRSRPDRAARRHPRNSAASSKAAAFAGAPIRRLPIRASLHEGGETPVTRIAAHRRRASPLAVVRPGPGRVRPGRVDGNRLRRRVGVGKRKVGRSPHGRLRLHRRPRRLRLQPGPRQRSRGRQKNGRGQGPGGGTRSRHDRRAEDHGKHDRAGRRER